MTTDTPTQEQPNSVLTEVKGLSVPDMTVVIRGADSALAMATTFVVTNDDDEALAVEELQSIKGRLVRLEASRTAITGPMNKALDAVNALFRGPRTTLESAEKAVKGSLLTYHEAKERKAAEARRVAEEAAAAERQRLADEARAAEERAAAERQRLAVAEAARVQAAAVERQRLADEAAAAAAAGNAEAAAAAALAANNAALEDELAAQQAQQREQAANQQANEEAAALRTAIAVVSAPVTNIAAAKVSGTSVRKTMDYEVTSLISLVQHVAKHPDLINLLATDSIKLKAYVRGLGVNTNLPGVRVFEKRSMSARAA